jgi:hypothetical protein
VVAVRLGAGILIALAVGAATAGPWVLAAIALAGILAFGALRSPVAGSPAGRWTRAFAGLARVVVFASAFGAYVFPGSPGLAAAALVVVVTAAGLAGVSLPDLARRWVAGALLLAAGVLVALCLAIRPVDVVAPLGPPPPGGLLLATLVMFPLLTRRPGPRAAWWIGGSTAVALAVAAAAIYQLGPDRLGFAVTSLRDLLSAADAAALVPLLTLVVVLSTVPAALNSFTEAKSEVTATVPVTLACGLGAAVAAAFAGPVVALALAAALAFAEILAGYCEKRG